MISPATVTCPTQEIVPRKKKKPKIKERKIRCFKGLLLMLKKKGTNPIQARHPRFNREKDKQSKRADITERQIDFFMFFCLQLWHLTFSF